MIAHIRSATDDDLAALAEIEIAADAMVVDLLAAHDWVGATAGHVRAAAPGFVLVVAEEACGPAVGFVHVVEGAGQAHLDQLAVLPSAGRQGLGRSLVEAAKSEAAARGYSSITLRTYADVPWNAPFYSTCGFVETVPSTAFEARFLEADAAEGLARYGTRLQMTASLCRP